jgi:ABC-type transporter MlaC component
MYNVAKSVPAEEYEKVEALLKAADAQLGAAGIFGEMGTSRTPEQVELEDKVEKAATEKSYKEALLELDGTDQQRLLKEMQAEVNRG